MALKEAKYDSWTFEVISRWHLDAPQKAKSRVAENHDIEYSELTAKVVDSGDPLTNALVTVIHREP